jgi:hypothetical protein
LEELDFDVKYETDTSDDDEINVYDCMYDVLYDMKVY